MQGCCNPTEIHCLHALGPVSERTLPGHRAAGLQEQLITADGRLVAPSPPPSVGPSRGVALLDYRADTHALPCVLPAGQRSASPSLLLASSRQAYHVAVFVVGERKRYRRAETPALSGKGTAASPRLRCSFRCLNSAALEQGKRRRPGSRAARGGRRAKVAPGTRARETAERAMAAALQSTRPLAEAPRDADDLEMEEGDLWDDGDATRASADGGGVDPSSVPAATGVRSSRNPIIQTICVSSPLALDRLSHGVPSLHCRWTGGGLCRRQRGRVIEAAHAACQLELR